MPTIHRRTVLSLAMLGVISSTAFGQEYPAKPITLVVPYPAGAAVDGVGRALALELAKNLGQSVVVENVGGASGSIGAARVRRSAPDGYTLMIGTVNDMVVAPTVMKSGYNAGDFTHIAKLSSNSTVLAAHPSFPANSVDELVALARASKEPILMGATGAAVMQTVGGVLLAESAGIKITNVVYKGGSPMVTDLLGGQIKVGTVALNSVLPYFRDGRLKALGVISTRRDPSAPEIPTVNEGSVVKGVEADLWTGLMGPANLPAPIVSRLSTALRAILTNPAYRDSQFKVGSIVASPEEAADFSRFVNNEQKRLAPVLATIKVE